MSVRRIVGILAPFIFLVATATAAWAHPGFEDPYVPAGRPATLALGVPAETVAPMVGVDIDMPADFTLTRLDQTPGWKSTATPGALHFTITTGSAPLGTYVDFTFAGIFPKKAVLLLPVTTHAQDGTEQQWNGKLTDRWPAAVVFPGYPVGKAPIAGLSTSSTSTRPAARDVGHPRPCGRRCPGADRAGAGASPEQGEKGRRSRRRARRCQAVPGQGGGDRRRSTAATHTGAGAGAEAWIGPAGRA